MTNEQNYCFVRSMMFSDLTEEQFIAKTNTIFEELVKESREFIRIYREGENGTISENERRILLEPISIRIAYSYFKLGNLPAFYVSLQK